MLIDSKHLQIKVEVIARGLHHPWAVAELPTGGYLMTERDHGRVRLISGSGDISEPLGGVAEVFRFHAHAGSQAGLFDVKLDPDFADNRFVYLSYSRPTDAGASVAIDRGVLSPGAAPGLESVKTIFELKQEDQDSSSLHFGGRMAFSPADGTLFLTVGDRRNMSRAQNLGDQAGTVLRMNRDGSVADGNPFQDEPGADPYIYSYGHRNSQGIAFQPGTGDLWENEHGPQGGDELNRIIAGGNYGWPLACAGVDYSGAKVGAGREYPGTIPAVHDFADTVAPSGLAFVTGDLFREWSGDILTGGLMTEGFIRQRLAGERVTEQETIMLGQRVRDVQLAGYGAILIVTDHEDGQLLRLSPA